MSDLVQQKKEFYEIYLIHGTWGRGIFPSISKYIDRFTGNKRWFEEGSDFRNRFQDQLDKANIDYEIDKFTWSGNNSIVERLSAANKLNDEISSKKCVSGRTRVFIGHSHAGNVLSHFAKINRSDCKNLFVSLATPYIGIRFKKQFNLGAGDSPLLYMIAVGMPGLIYALLYSMFSVMLFLVKNIPFIGYYSKNIASVERSILNAAEWLLNLPRYFGIPGLCILVVLFIVAAIANTILIGVLNEEKMKKMEALNNDGISWAPEVKLLTIRTHDDEADYALKIASLGNRLAIVSTKISLILVKTYPYIIVGFPIFNFILSIILPVGQDPLLMVRGESYPKLTYSNFVDLTANFYKDIYFGVFIISSFTLAMLIMSTIFRSFYGRELILGSLNSTLIVQPNPDSEYLVDTKTLFGKSYLLYHFIYNHRDCPVTITDWLKSFNKV